MKEKELSYKGCVLSTAVAMALNGFNNTYYEVVPIMVSQAVAFKQGNLIPLTSGVDVPDWTDIFLAITISAPVKKLPSYSLVYLTSS